MSDYGDDYDDFDMDDRDYDDHPGSEFDANFGDQSKDYDDRNWYAEEDDYTPITRKTCRNGPNCVYFRNSTCRFYHPPQDYQANQLNDIQSASDDQQYGYGVDLDDYISDQEARHYQGNRLYDWKNSSQKQQLYSHSNQSKLVNTSSQFPSLLDKMNKLNLKPKQEVKDKKQFQTPFFKVKDNLKAPSLLKKEPEKNQQYPILWQNFVNPTPEVKQESKISMKEPQESTESKVLLLYCKGPFHEDCVRKWLSESRSQCPVCLKYFKNHGELSKKEEKKQEQSSLGKNPTWFDIINSFNQNDSYSDDYYQDDYYQDYYGEDD